MLLHVLCVRDSAADVFGQPMFVASVGGAVRSFGDEVNNDKSPMFRHPGDFTLWRLGTFDDGHGRFDLLDAPEQVARAVDYVNVKK